MRRNNDRNKPSDRRHPWCRMAAAFLAVIIALQPALPASSRMAYAAETEASSPEENGATPAKAAADNAGAIEEIASEIQTDTESDPGTAQESPAEETAETPAEENAESEASSDEKEEEKSEESEPATEKGEKAETITKSKTVLEMTLTASDRRTYRVTVTASPEAGIPEGARLSVRELNAAESDTYLDRALNDLDPDGEQYYFYSRFFDVSIIYEDEEIQPKAPVEVSIKLTDTLQRDFGAAGARSLQVIHFDESGKTIKAEELDSDISTNRTSAEVTFETEGFSVFAVSGVARMLANWVDDHMDIALFGVSYDSEIHPFAADVSDPEPGVEVLEAYSLSSSERLSDLGPLWLSVILDPEMDLKARESISVYSVKNGGVEKELMNDLPPGEDITVRYHAAEDSLALVLDTGLRSRTLTAETDESDLVVLNGLLPEEAEASASDVTAEYAEEGAIAAFDISILEGKEEFQPEEGHPIAVEIMSDAIGEAVANDTPLSVIHIADDGSRENVTDFAVEENRIYFEASGFSAYAIIEGPKDIPDNWRKITSVDQLSTIGSQGVYMGHINGYYFTNGITKINNSRYGITKTKPVQSYPGGSAVLYYFEKEEGTENQFRVYCMKDGEKKYIVQTTNSLNLTDAAHASVFTIEPFGSQENVFRAKGSNGYYWNMQGGANGASFAAYQGAEDENARMVFWYYITPDGDPLGLTGSSFGLLNWNNGTTGKAMMANASGENALEALPLTVMSKGANSDDRLFVPDDSDITMWTFEWVDSDVYHLTAVQDGSTKYLSITPGGLSLVSEPDDSCRIHVTPGTGDHTGEIALKAGSTSLTYSGSTAGGFNTSGAAGSEWLKLAVESELTSDYFMTYSASKIGVADPSVTNGSRIIVYTRAWNETTKKYELYAIDHDGTLVPCYESGDSIQWVGGRLNTMLWNFVEYYWEGTNDPNFYYDLYNQYSESYLAPQVSSNQILSDEPIGVNMNGRRFGFYYSSILAWDEDAYNYVGLKVEDGRIVPCPYEEADDLYFAVMQDVPDDDDLTLVPTVDHKQYGITMKLIDFSTKPNNNPNIFNEQDTFLGNTNGGMNMPPTQGMLSTDLGNDGYPKNSSGTSMATLFAGAQEANHLFIGSTYSGTGYYEFDSTQNFASFDKNTGDFKVYKELGTMDNGNKPSLKHGQFMPFNDLEPGVYASVNGKNLYNALMQSLPDSDPRKGEQMYLVAKPDYFFGVEIEASFTQTPNGHDAWGHDIIYEFTGDDDFWLYVDDELVIDLGGIHSALPGTVNFSTGEVSVNNVPTTLRDVFYNNYKGRGHTDAQAQAYVDELFEQNSSGQWIFKEYTTHTMRIFFMERGAGASNLHMRFNLASVKPGTIELNKELAGVDDSESILAQFPYQVWYKTDASDEPIRLSETHTRGASAVYKDSTTPVPFRSRFSVDGVSYPDVYLLKPGETAEITLPEDAVSYEIVECGVNTDVYSSVSVNGKDITGNAVSGHANRRDYKTGYARSDERARVAYVNTVNPEALRDLTITKKLYREDGHTAISHSEDDSTFSFRLYFGPEYEDKLTPANMHTYHVLDPDGNYCRWNKTDKVFESIGVSDYSALNAAEKKSVSFTTSMNGSISKIPAFYTVEIREVLAGTQYKVEERESEIPDGYSLQKYVLFEDKNDGSGSDSDDPVQGTLVANKDPHVDVCNLRGWGLRVNKLWSDKDYMASRDDVYFAVYTDNGSGDLTLVDGTVRRMNQKEGTLYWYFLRLPVSGVSFDDFLLREVTLKNPVVDEEGVVTSYDSITCLENGSELKLNGRQKGETETSEFKYTVLYEKGVTDADSNVRVDTVTNNRPGIVLKKQDASGRPLAGVSFTLEDNEGNLIGSFTSNSEGAVTTAFLRDNVDYTLKETKTPQGYHGLEAPAVIRLSGGNVTVSGLKTAEYTLTQGAGRTPELVLKNRPFTFRVIKTDAATEEPLAGVHFALHRQVTVGSVTAFDTNPMPGFEDLVSGSDGILPGLDNTLPAGTYELREKAPLSGYRALASHVHFGVSTTGKVSLGACPNGVSLDTEDLSDGTLAYTLNVPNEGSARLTISKTVEGEAADMTQSFEFTLESVEGTEEGAAYAWTKTAADGTTTSGIIAAGGTFTLAHGDSIVIMLPMQKAVVISENNGEYTTGWSLDGDTPVPGSSATVTLTKDSELAVTNTLNAVSQTGLDLRSTPFILILAAALLMAAALGVPALRKRRAKDSDDN